LCTRRNPTSPCRVAFQRSIIFNVVIDRIHANLDGGTASDGVGRQGQLQGSIIDTRHVASAGWLVVLGLEAEGVHVDAARRHVLVVLVWLYQVEVATIALREAVVAVELQLGERHGVLAVLEGNGHEHVVGTAGSDAGHGASLAIRAVHQGGVGASPDARAGVGQIGLVGVVEPLLAQSVGSSGNRAGLVGDVLVALYDPNQFLAGVIEVELQLVVGGRGGLVTGELQLLDQVLV